MGHEPAGVVTAVGPDVTEFEVGDHVVGSLVQFCGVCAKCVTGHPSLCSNPSATVRAEGDEPRLSAGGDAINQGMALGGFAQQMLIHENQAVKVPKEIPFPQASLLGCGVVTGAGAVLNTADVQAGESIVVVGAGGVGLNALNGALTAGAGTIIAIDLADEKLDRAKDFGATHVVNSTKEDPVEAVKKITDGGADHVFDFVGLKQTVQQAVDMAALGGGVYLVGALDPTVVHEYTAVDMVSTRRRIQGVYMGSTNPKRDIPAYAQLYLQGRFELDSLVSKEISLGEINEGYASLADPTLARVVITDFS